MLTPAQSIHGAILGTIVGDALGLPYEALSRRRALKLMGEPNRFRFFLKYGMMSDDGEHTCMVAQSLVKSAGDVERFRRSLAWRFRWWLLGIPAGVGSATLRSILKLWIGISSNKSGVWSAGNGPAMRAAILGAAVRDPIQLRQLIRASTYITHRDPKAFGGAMAVALAARCSSEGLLRSAYLDRLRNELANDNANELLELIERATISAESNETTLVFADRIGCSRGVSGYVYHTVPVAIHAWLSYPTSFEQATRTVIECGGDTDSVAAIVGGIVGSATGIDGIPQSLRDNLLEWPRSNRWIEHLALAVDRAMNLNKSTPVPNVGPFVIFRNLFFLLVVLIHILRRALPPY